MSTTDSREGKEDTLPIRIVPAMMAPSSPSNQSTLSALAIIACVALHPVLAAPAFPTDRVLFNRQPYYLTPNTQRGGRTTKTAGRSALGLQDIALNDQLTRGLNVHGGGLGGRIPGAPFNIRHNAAAKNDDDSATTDSLGLQLSEEISRCVGTTTAAPQSAHLSTRGGSTEAAPLPDEEQTSAVVDTAAKSSKEVDEPNNAAQYAKKLKVCALEEQLSITIALVYFMLISLLVMTCINSQNFQYIHSQPTFTSAPKIGRTATEPTSSARFCTVRSACSLPACTTSFPAAASSPA